MQNWYRKSDSILASYNGILDVLEGLLGGPGALKSKLGGGLLNVRFAFPSKPSFFTPTCLEIVPKWGLFGVSGSLYVHKNGWKNVLRGPYAAQRWVSILCLLHAPCAISIANSKTRKHRRYQFEGKSFSGCGGFAWASSIIIVVAPLTLRRAKAKMMSVACDQCRFINTW